MKLRRTSTHADLRTLPLDGTDTFLLSLAAQPLTLDELMDVMPCPANDTVLRVEKLLQLKLLSKSKPCGLFDDELVPELAPFEEGSDLELHFDEREDCLPFPDPDDGFAELEEAAAQAALFAAEPPSTLISLFKRGPLHVDIRTVAPPSTSPTVSEGSNVFHRPRTSEHEPGEAKLQILGKSP